MAITAQMVKELRERTGAGMMQCKKSLIECDGDIEKAVEVLRKTGLAKADNKSSRVAAEGIVIVKLSDNNQEGVIVEINCETDFVGRDENFLNFSNEVAAVALDKKSSSVEALDIEEKRKALISKIGENIQVRRVNYVKSDGVLGAYVHGGRIGVLVESNGLDADTARDIAMHIAASNPIVVNKEDVPEELLAKERDIFTAQANESGKPAEIIEKMIQGRISKFVGEVSLVGQPFVKDPDQKVGQLLKSKNASVKNFIRFAVGEGIEKKEDNFVKEVMEQVK